MYVVSSKNWNSEVEKVTDHCSMAVCNAIIKKNLTTKKMKPKK